MLRIGPLARPDPDLATPWGFGLIVALFCALFHALLLVTVFELISHIAILLGLFAVGVVSVGIGLALWEVRDKAVWRWVVWGSAIGLVAGLGGSLTLLALGLVQ